MAEYTYELRCLICGEPQEKITPEYPGKSHLVALQKHVTEVHGVDVQALRETTSVTHFAFEYRLPDGRPWMLAVQNPPLVFASLEPPMPVIEAGK